MTQTNETERAPLTTGEEQPSKGRGHARYHHTRICSHCGSTRVKRAHRTGTFEVLFLPLVLYRPFTCHSCLRRFYGFSSGSHTTRRAFLSLAIMAALVLVLWTAWRIVVFLTETKPTPPPGPVE